MSKYYVYESSYIDENVIGKNAKIGEEAVVTKDVRDHALVNGAPAVEISFMNEEGRISGYEKEMSL